MQNSQVFRWLMNSVIVSGFTTVGVLILSSLAGYGFARLDFPGRDKLFVFVLFGLAIPEQAVIITRHQMFSALHLHNSYPGLILPGLAAPFGVFLMTQYFRAIPKELDEAAMLDNASRFTVFWKVLLPLTIPAQATLGIFTFLSSWNDYWWPLISATRSEMFTLTVGLASSQINFAQTSGLGYLMTQAVFASVPILIVYVIFQKYIVRAVSGAAVRDEEGWDFCFPGPALPGAGRVPASQGRTYTHITVQRIFGECRANVPVGQPPLRNPDGECEIVTGLLDEFEKENPDIRLKVNIAAWPGYDQLSAEYAAGDPPDITIHVHSMSAIPDYQKRGLIVPLDDDFKKAGIDPAAFTPAARNGVTVASLDGKPHVYGMPFDNWTQLWHINTALFAKAGLMKDGDPILPHSPEEFITEARQFKQATGLLVHIDPGDGQRADDRPAARNLFTYLLDQKAVFFTDPKHIKLNTPQARRIVDLFHQLYAENLMSHDQDYPAAMAAFLNGQGGVLMNGTWVIGALNATESETSRAVRCIMPIRSSPIRCCMAAPRRPMSTAIPGSCRCGNVRRHNGRRCCA